jgi:hypothetical protein
MKHRSVETTKLYETRKEEISKKISEVNSLALKRIKKLVSALAVAAALFGPEGGVNSEKVKEVLAQDTIEDIQEDLIRSGQDISAWVRERGLPAAREGYDIASENVSQAVETATPVIEKAVVDLYDFVVNEPETVENIVQNTQILNKTVELNLSDLDGISLDKEITEESKKLNLVQTSKVEPVEFGSEQDELSFYQIHKEENLSIRRPFDFKETNNVMQSLALNIEEILSPEYEKIKFFDALTNPSVEPLKIFPESVMEWSQIIEEEAKIFNSKPENKDFQVSPNEAMTILTIESWGNERAYNKGSTATGAFQFMPVQFYNDYILTGAFDGGEGRIISFPEFQSKLMEKRYSTRLFLKYWSDLERYNQNIYNELGIDTPMARFQFRLAEYNGGQLNAINIFLNNPAAYETQRYVRMGTRVAVIAEVANELREQGFPNDYYKMLDSKLIKERIAKAYTNKDLKNAGDFKSTNRILETVGQEEFTAGVVTRKLFLDEIPEVLNPTPTIDANTEEYKYYSNPAIDIIYDFEYRNS